MSKNLLEKEPDDQLDKLIHEKGEQAKEERIKSWFENIAWLELSNEDKQELSLQITDQMKSDGLYWTQLILSSVIATFGLLQNSGAVIIGAMLISPLLSPIQGLAFGIASGQSGSIWKSTKLLIQSVLIAVLVSWIFSTLTPLRTETTEILARTAPNILDFFVALASGILALLALSYKKLSNSIAGVAMAAALLPPLAVIGIECSLWNLDLVWSSSLLFITNLLAILIVGVPIFIFYGFYPHQAGNQKVAIRDSVILMIGIGIITVPLFGSLLQITQRIQLQQTAEQTVQKSLANTLPDAVLKELQLISFTDEKVELSSTIIIPENQEFFSETRELIRKELGKQLQRETTLSLQIIPIASIISQKELEQQDEEPLSSQIQKSIHDLMRSSEIKTTIISIDITKVESDLSAEVEEEDPKMKWAINTIFSLPSAQNFGKNHQLDLESSLKKLYPKESMSFFWTAIAQKDVKNIETEESPQEQFRGEITLKWKSFLKQTLPETAEIEDITINWETQSTDSNEKPELFDPKNISKYNIHFDVYIPNSDQRKLNSLDRKIQRFARRNFDIITETYYRIFPFLSGKNISIPPNSDRISKETSEETETLINK